MERSGRTKRLARHDGRDGVLVDELDLAFPAQQDAEIVKPCHNTLELYAIDQKDGQRNLLLADGVQKNVLEVLFFIVGHGLVFLFATNRLSICCLCVGNHGFAALQPWSLANRGLNG
jgi:hypothetical protein